MSVAQVLLSYVQELQAQFLELPHVAGKLSVVIPLSDNNVS